MEATQIAGKNGLRCGAILEASEMTGQHAGRATDESIMHPVTVATGLHQAMSAKIAQVFRDFDLWFFEGGLQMADAQWTS